MHTPRNFTGASLAAARALLLVSSLAIALTAARAGAGAPPAAATPPASPPRAGAQASAEPEGRTVLKGEIVDLGCYLMHEGRGDTHAACAQACVKGGAPVGLLADGVLYVLFAPHETTAPFEEAKRLVGRSAVVTGVVHGRGGLRGLAVTMVSARS